MQLGALLASEGAIVWQCVQPDLLSMVVQIMCWVPWATCLAMVVLWRYGPYSSQPFLVVLHHARLRAKKFFGPYRKLVAVYRNLSDTWST